MQGKEFSGQREYSRALLSLIHAAATAPVCLMEVCGTHTMAIARSGMRELLPPTVRLISGPGCPVCVTDDAEIDAMIDLARQPGVTVATYGDMVRVPGSETSLQEAKARGADVRIVYSALDALQLARDKPEREIVLLGIGFETTAPTVAVALEQAVSAGLRNFSVFSVHKAILPVLAALATDPGLRIDGFLLPGHVCAVTGTLPFDFLAAKYRRPCVVAGFEPVDILEAVLMLLRQQAGGEARVENQYQRVVRPAGNPAAQAYLREYFTLADSQWRGIGRLPASGYVLQKKYAAWDAREKFGISVRKGGGSKPCACGEILKGQKQPAECPLFGTGCTPDHPAGPCMVSREGACAASYQFRRANCED